MPIFSRFFFIEQSDIQRRDREEHLLSVKSFPKWPQWLEMSRSKMRNPEPLPGLPLGCRVPKVWAIFAFPGHKLEGGWEAGLLGLELMHEWDFGTFKARSLAARLLFHAPKC